MRIYVMRKTEYKYNQIGIENNISANRARQIFKKIERMLKREKECIEYNKRNDRK